MKTARKAFFAEEKKQKTFTFRPWPINGGVPRKQKFFGSFFQKRTFFLLLACSFAAAAQAQKPAPRHAQVGAGDIFAALTQPDHPAELEALHALRDALNGSPDPERLQAARARLAEVLQAEERHQGDMPPALVMSGISSRIEAAIAGLEEARHAPPLAPDRLQTLLVPGLAAMSAALGVALIACLAGLAARARRAEEQEEMQDTLKKIRRRLEGGAPAAAGGLAQEMASGEASEAVHQATVAVDRLSSATRDAEGRLQTSVSDAEARLHAAAHMAGQLEQWMESLPERLAGSVQAIEARGLPDIEAAVARIEDGAAGLAEFQDMLADYGGAVSGLTAQAELATANLHGQVSVMYERFEALAGSLPERIAGALPAALGELNSAADLLAELSSLAIGQTGRLEDIVARADTVACDLPAVAQVLAQAAADLLGQVDRGATLPAAAARVADDLAEMSRLARAAADSLPERLEAAACAVEARLEASAGVVAESLGRQLAAAADAVEGRLAGGADRVQAQLEAGAGAVGEALAQRVALAAETVGTRFTGRAELLQAGLEQAAMAVANAAATLPEIRDGLREAALGLAAESSALLNAARARVAGDGASGIQGAPSMEAMAGLGQTLVALTGQLETALGTAETLRVQAAEQADSIRAGETDQVATLFEVLAGRAEACLSALPSEAAALAATAAQLRGDAAELAASAMRMGGDASGSNQMPAEAGTLLTALQSVCQRLDETLAAFGETGLALNDGVERIRRETQRMQDGSASAEAVLAGATAGDPATQLAVLTGRLSALLEDFRVRAGQMPQSFDGDTRGGPLLDAMSAQAERMAAVLDRNEQLADRLAEAAHAVAVASAERPVPVEDALSAAQPVLIGLQAATETVQRAAARLLESAQGQDAALARAGQAAAEVARLVAAPKADVAEGHALAGLTGIASLAESLQGEAESLAACVLRGDAGRIPAELISQTPVMLAAIETSIHRLRGTATALALASDGRLKAA
jgi:hypothetical protein